AEPRREGHALDVHVARGRATRLPAQGARRHRDPARALARRYARAFRARDVSVPARRATARASRRPVSARSSAISTAMHRVRQSSACRKVPDDGFANVFQCTPRKCCAEVRSMVKVGVVLSGCGFYDGSEIHEAVLTLLALDRAGATAV